MRIQFFLTSAIFICTFQLVISQQEAEEKAIKNIIRVESESYIQGIPLLGRDNFIQNEMISWDFYSFSYSESYVGWQKISPMMLLWIHQSIPIYYCYYEKKTKNRNLNY